MVENKKTKSKKNEQHLLKTKWGNDVIAAGWTAIPNILIERQQSLKIDPVKLNILLILFKYWWDKNGMPYPSKQTIAEIINRDKSTVQKHIAAMEEMGLIKRIERYHVDGKGQKTNEHDLSGIISKLKELAKEELALNKGRKEEDARRRRGVKKNEME